MPFKSHPGLLRQAAGEETPLLHGGHGPMVVVLLGDKA